MKKRTGLFFLLLTMFMLMMPFCADAKNLNALVLSGSGENHARADWIGNTLAEVIYSYDRVNTHIAKYDQASDPATKEDVDSIISQTFAGAGDEDINVLWYIGHGTCTNSNNVLFSWLQQHEFQSSGFESSPTNGLTLSGSSTYTYFDLSERLAQIPGKVILVLDCCGSGDFLNYGYRSSIGSSSVSSSKSSKISVLTSSQYSKLSPMYPRNDGNVFSDVLLRRITGNEYALEADKNKDAGVTLSEMHNTMYYSAEYKIQDLGAVPQLRDNSGDTVIFQFAKTKQAKEKLELTVGDKFIQTADVEKCGKADPEVYWESSDSSVVYVTNVKNREVRLNANKAGEVTLISYLKDHDGNKIKKSVSECKITVAPDIKLTPESAKIGVKETLQLSAEVRGCDAKIKWKSSNSAVAKVSSKGKVTGVKKGTATITAYVSFNGKTYGKTCKVTVKKLSWKEIYKKFLEKRTTTVKDGSRNVNLTLKSYCVLNIDRKGVPELIVKSYSPTMSGPYTDHYVFTIKDEKVVCRKYYTVRDEIYIYYSKKHKALRSAGWTNGTGGVWFKLTRLGTRGLEEYKFMREDNGGSGRVYQTGNTSARLAKVSKASYLAFSKTYFKNSLFKTYKFKENTPANRNISFGK